MKTSTGYDWSAILGQLGEHLKGGGERLEAAIAYASLKNPWFTTDYIHQALEAIIEQYLDPQKLRQWLNAYLDDKHRGKKRIGAVLAGNIPMVGFHDIICILTAGHEGIIKLSERDDVLLPFLFKELAQIDANIHIPLQWVDKLVDFDAVITTGSDQSAAYFEKYFGKYPHIIRRNRHAVAVLNGDENTDQIEALGRDVFDYYGLGCRSVSKIYVPVGYQFNLLLDHFDRFQSLMQNNKYRNNFDFNLATFVVNRKEHLSNQCLILLEEDSISSRIGTLHYSFYRDPDHLRDQLEAHGQKIQCVVSGRRIEGTDSVPFGAAHKPSLDQYADGVDTMVFLSKL